MIVNVPRGMGERFWVTDLNGFSLTNRRRISLECTHVRAGSGSPCEDSGRWSESGKSAMMIGSTASGPNCPARNRSRGASRIDKVHRWALSDLRDHSNPSRSDRGQSGAGQETFLVENPFSAFRNSCVCLFQVGSGD